MQLLAVSGGSYDDNTHILDAMHQLRARIFEGRMAWDVESVHGREADSFDSLNPTYILALNEQGRLAGCARLLPAMGPTMLAAMFPDLVATGLLSPHAAMIESSRFCVDTALAEGRAGGSLHEATLTLFAGIIEWSIANGYTEIVTGTDLRVERILKRAGWPMRRLGEPRSMGDTMAVAGSLPADLTSLQRVRPASYRSSISSPRLQAA